MRVWYDEDARLEDLEGEIIAVLGYGIQGRAQAHNLRDGGFRPIIGNREDAYAERAREDGFEVLPIREAAHQATLSLLLLPDEVHTEMSLRPEAALVVAHGFSIHYNQLKPRADLDVMLLAPRMPGQYVRQRFLENWGVPAFASVYQDATGRAEKRLLALARALGFTRCAVFEATMAQETQLDHFSEHYTYPLILAALESAFEFLIQEGYPPELALMELHGSGELGQVLSAAAREGITGMLESHASPACQVGIAHYWGTPSMREALARIHDGSFAQHLLDEQRNGYPELQGWRAERSQRLQQAEASLQRRLRGSRQKASGGTPS